MIQSLIQSYEIFTRQTLIPVEPLEENNIKALTSHSDCRVKIFKLVRFICLLYYYMILFMLQFLHMTKVRLFSTPEHLVTFWTNMFSLHKHKPTSLLIFIMFICLKSHSEVENMIKKILGVRF